MKFIKFICHERRFTVQPKLTGPVTVIHHAPEGWNQITRMWRRSAVEWQGAQGIELQIPWIFDQWGFNPAIGRARNSVEDQIARIERLAEYDFGFWRTLVFTIDGDGQVPWDIHNAPSKQWVVGGLTLNDDYILNLQGDRCRQSGTINIIEFLQEVTVQSKNRIPTKRVPATYRLKKGDTLIKIAVYYYGDGSQWKAIANLNRIHDPNHPGKPGRVIRLPR